LDNLGEGEGWAGHRVVGVCEEAPTDDWWGRSMTAKKAEDHS